MEGDKFEWALPFALSNLQLNTKIWRSFSGQNNTTLLLINKYEFAPETSLINWYISEVWVRA